MPTEANRPLRHSQRVLGDYIGANNADNEFVSSAVTANADGSVLERLKYLQTLQLAADTAAAVSGQSLYLPRVTPKAIAAAGTSLTMLTTPVTLFTVTGTVLARVWAVTGATALTSTLNNGTLSVGVLGAVAALLAAATADGTNFAIGSVWVGDNSPTLKAETLSLIALAGALVASDITCTVATNAMTAGVITFYCEWRPVSVGATVVAA